MAMQFMSSQIYQQNNRAVLPPEFYDHVSEIIKIFRKQITTFVKLSSSFIQGSEAYKEIKQKKDQGMEIVKFYQQVIVDDNLYIVIQRFIGRVKEIIQLTPNLHLGIVNFISNCLKKLQLYMHKNVNTMTMFHVFSDILNILPSYFENKPFSPQKGKRQNKEISPFPQAKTSALDHILQSYRKSFSVLSTLDIDETQYRAVFFSARDDRYKGTAFLQSQMRYRNRFIKQQMNRYDNNYVSYMDKKKREKQSAKKKRVSRLKRIMSVDQQTSIIKIVTSKTRNQQNDPNSSFVVHSLKQISSNNSCHTPELKTITQIPQKNSNLQQTAYNFNRTRDKNNKSDSNYNQDNQKNNSGKKSYGKVRQEDFQDFINDIKTKGEFRMTKVLFGKDGKLELSPFTNEQKQQKNPVFNGLKNKIIFRKAQQNIRKKFNRMATQPPSSKQNTKEKRQQPKQIKNYLSTQHSESNTSYTFDSQNYKNVKKVTFKEKQIKLMGIKGVSNKIKSNSFDDTEKFWSNNISTYMRVQEKSLI